MSEPITKRLRNCSNRAVAGPSTVTISNQTNEPSLKRKHDLEQSNSMYGLSDECLRKIFERLNVESLCHMANVCKRFRQIAVEVFDYIHKELMLEGKCTDSMFRRVLLKFGQMITSIDASDAYFFQIDTDAIAKYCPTKLEKLSLRQAKINCAAFQPLFVRMKELVLDGCEFVGNKENLFAGCSKLEYLYFDSNEDSCGFVAQKYPNLSGLAFDPNFTSFFTFFKLLQLNPQIKYLQIMTMAQDIYISSVVQYNKNLERLMIIPGMVSSTAKNQTQKVFLQLAKLKKLKKLKLYAGQEIYAKSVAPLIDAFVKGAVGIDQLELRDFKISSKTVKSIANLKTLETLALDTIGKDVSNADLLSLSKLPLLTNLILYFGHQSKTPIRVDTLTEMIKEGKRITRVALVRVRNLKIGQKEFETLLDAVQSRNDGSKLTIQIIGCNTTTSFNVPQSIQQKCIDQMKIIYEADDE